MGSQMKSVFSSNEQKEIKKWGIFSLIFTNVYILDKPNLFNV